jgi:3-phenylpropionate/cinnamic acid dioxygenase small subunit
VTQPAIDAEVRRTMAAYCHTVDDGRFDEFEQLWAADAVVEVRGDRIEGRAAIRAWIEQAQPPERRGKHVTVNSEIDVAGADTASSVSDFLFFARGERGPRVTASGRYLDEFTPVEGAWVFTRRRIVLDR